MKKKLMFLVVFVMFGILFAPAVFAQGVKKCYYCYNCSRNQRW